MGAMPDFVLLSFLRPKNGAAFLTKGRNSWIDIDRAPSLSSSRSSELLMATSVRLKFTIRPSRNPVDGA